MPKFPKWEDLPPKIQEAWKRKGWPYPPTEELLKQWKEAWERIIGEDDTEPELLEELWREMGWRRSGRKAKLS
ncbi:MAG: hypothetical protein NZ937_07125 [Armatimonadetes bacterium]|nr:hypothetical protein [Armatimonadota bacterium]